MGKQTTIQLTEAEIWSGVDRVRFAELLIRQLPASHDGRNSWLLNYGTGPDVDAMRKEWEKATGKTFPPAGGMVAVA
jgi:hypothetical protein